MAWTTPRTWTTGELVTAAIMNTHVRDNETFLKDTKIEVLNRNLSTVDVTNTAVETSLYSFSIPAGTLGATGGIRLTLAGDTLENAGSAETWLLKIKLGATTVLATQAVDSVANADRRKWRLNVDMLNSAANAQRWSAFFHWGIPAANAFPVIGGSSTSTEEAVGYNTSAEDTASARTLDVTVIWSAATAVLSFRKQMALLEMVPA